MNCSYRLLHNCRVEVNKVSLKPFLAVEPGGLPPLRLFPEPESMTSPRVIAGSLTWNDVQTPRGRVWAVLRPQLARVNKGNCSDVAKQRVVTSFGIGEAGVGEAERRVLSETGSVETAPALARSFAKKI
jgi:hypothetical protein